MPRIKLDLNILADPLQFIRRLYIKNKKGKLVKFEPNYEQVKVLEALMTGKNVLVIKARQCGISTIIRAWQFWKVYTARNPIWAAVLSHKADSANHLHKIDKTFYTKLPVALKRKLSSETNRTLAFNDTKAQISSFTAQGDGGLRSFTFTDLHISEFAFFDNADEVLATAISAVNDGQIVIESTANYYGDALHQEVIKAQLGEADWTLLEFYWHEHKEYSLPAPATFKDSLTEEEQDFRLRYDLTLDQLYWRRKTVERLGIEKFRREYPACLNDCFAQTGNTYYTENDLQHIVSIPTDTLDNVVFHKYDPTDAYAIGCDVASGVGRDYSVAIVLSKKTYQPVAIYCSNKVTPSSFAKQIHAMNIAYGNAKILIESNNHGGTVLNELGHLGCHNLWTDEDKKDWNTNLKTKLIMHEELKSMITNGIITNIDSITVSELRSLLLDEKGLAPSVPANLPHHGDRVIALALAIQCLKKVSLPIKQFLPDWVIKQRAQKIRENGSFGAKNRY